MNSQEQLRDIVDRERNFSQRIVVQEGQLYSIDRDILLSATRRGVRGARLTVTRDQATPVIVERNSELKTLGQKEPKPGKRGIVFANVGKTYPDLYVGEFHVIFEGKEFAFTISSSHEAIISEISPFR